MPVSGDYAAITRPSGPARLTSQSQAVADEYKAHYKIDMFGPSPNKKKA